MTPTELVKILEDHRKWREGAGGARAYLAGADLAGANLARADLVRADLAGANLDGADLAGANLTDANLAGADLAGADLTDADLAGADLAGANLTGANLARANLTGAYLTGAYLAGANLVRANLAGADLADANLDGAKLPGFQVPQEGTLIVWKKLAQGALCKLAIPAEAKRTGSLVGRKCRAEFAHVLMILDATGTETDQGWSLHTKFVYVKGETVRPDSYNDDVRIECAGGIHFFLSREEAEAYT
jgi:hypothetical protein